MPNLSGKENKKAKTIENEDENSHICEGK